MAINLIHALSSENDKLKREVHALEHLVYRYQDELCNATSRHKISDVDELIEMDEVLYENQTLDQNSWLDQITIPQYTSKFGECCSFGEVTLPSAHWQWINDWRLEIGRSTDEEVWVYAHSWQQSHHDASHWKNKRSVHDTVRRRQWKRKRVYTGRKRLIVEPNKYLIHVDSNVKLKHVNQKLTDQLLMANSRLMDYEKRIKSYESKLDFFYRRHKSFRGYRTWKMSSNREAEEIEILSDDTQQHLDTSCKEKIDSEYHAVQPEATDDYERKRSAIVEECENELNNAIRDLRAMRKRISISAGPTSLYADYSSEQCTDKE